MNTRTRVVLVDDHSLVRRGLAVLLRLDGRHDVVGEAGTGEAAVPLIEAERPDLVILDLNMPGIDGLETLRRVRAKGLTTRVLVLSMHDETHLVGQALSAGADGYLLKDSMDDELFFAIESVLRGQRYLAAAIDRARLQESRMRPVSLTAREREVLQLIANGLTTSAVAEALNISPHTATRHRANLMQKLNVHNQVELVRIAASQGLIVLQTPT
ncbi:MAG TPA: DNA-binding response regulator [Gemmatimonas aurantiaca]|uniref:NarL family two-component response regulator n=2 Tax=Gemmatimonas aurantiaca TaxID=173480 RepID=C1A5E6_GEMAT|nr:response regulator transcription factor [Gemmatimonas aurantiaca]BAH37456.1 NarL family two-component response regulator [Gemmatimonas aurantiaca T-27]HCT55872.1 DNA-binding response regulator [Gemmatimonas aurantiaca]